MLQSSCCIQPIQKPAHHLMASSFHRAAVTLPTSDVCSWILISKSFMLITNPHVHNPHSIKPSCPYPHAMKPSWYQPLILSTPHAMNPHVMTPSCHEPLILSTPHAMKPSWYQPLILSTPHAMNPHANYQPSCHEGLKPSSQRPPSPWVPGIFDPYGALCPSGCIQPAGNPTSSREPHLIHPLKTQPPFENTPPRPIWPRWFWSTPSCQSAHTEPYPSCWWADGSSSSLPLPGSNKDERNKNPKNNQPPSTPK